MIKRKPLMVLTLALLGALVLQGCAMAVGPYGGGIEVIDSRPPKADPYPAGSGSSAPQEEEEEPAAPAGGYGSNGAAKTPEAAPVILDMGSPRDCFKGITSVDAYYIFEYIDSPYLNDTLAWMEDLTPETAAWVRSYSSTKYTQRELIDCLNIDIGTLGENQKWLWIRIYAVPEKDGEVTFYLMAR